MTSAQLVYATVVAAWILVLAPALVYLATGWKNRRDRLWEFLTGDVLREYYKLFNPQLDFGADDAAYVGHFRARFNVRYGQQHYIGPIGLLAAVSGLALVAVAETVLKRVINLPPIALMAVLGAYLWVVWDQLNRLRCRDFTIHDIYGCSFRFLIAVPLGVALASIVTEPLKPTIAFMIGAFPTSEIFRILRRNAGKPLGLDDTELKDAPTELVQLQGVSRGVAERFQEEGFTTIPQLAWTEPVDLAIRTNFDFDYVIDCQSQALLWTYFPGLTPTLTPFMLRGAMEAAEMMGSPARKGPAIEHAPKETIRAAAAAIKMDEAAFAQTLLEIARDPYTQILCAIWYPEWLGQARQSGP